MSEEYLKSAVELLGFLIDDIVKDTEIEVQEIEDGYVLNIPIRYEKPKKITEIPEESLEISQGEEWETGQPDETLSEEPQPDETLSEEPQPDETLSEEEISADEESLYEYRTQYVYITANRQDMDNTILYQVFTICAPENPNFYKSALLLNMNLPYGAIAISKVEGQNYFVLVDTYIADVVSPEELKASILSLAEVGDKLEKELIGEDIS